MNDVLRIPDLSWDDRVALLAYRLRQMPTAIDKDEFAIKHFFRDPWYVRELELPADLTFVGRKHIYGHIVKLLAGECMVIRENGYEHFAAGAVIHTQPGYQMVVYTKTDIIAQAWHFNPDGNRNITELEIEHYSLPEAVLDRGQAVELHLQERGKWLEQLQPLPA